jgi:hypothetical protein
LAPFVTYMEVGNADLVWNTDRPSFARVTLKLKVALPPNNGRVNRAAAIPQGCIVSRPASYIGEVSQ